MAAISSATIAVELICHWELERIVEVRRGVVLSVEGSAEAVSETINIAARRDDPGVDITGERLRMNND